MSREEALEIIKSHPFLFASFPDDVIEALDVLISEGEPVLDKIRADIVELWQNEPCAIEGGCLDEILEIIDKYKADKEKK